MIANDRNRSFGAATLNWKLVALPEILLRLYDRYERQILSENNITGSRVIPACHGREPRQ